MLGVTYTFQSPKKYNICARAVSYDISIITPQWVFRHEYKLLHNAVVHAALSLLAKDLGVSVSPHKAVYTRPIPKTQSKRHIADDTR